MGSIFAFQLIIHALRQHDRVAGGEANQRLILTLSYMHARLFLRPRLRDFLKGAALGLRHDRAAENGRKNADDGEQPEDARG